MQNVRFISSHVMCNCIFTKKKLIVSNFHCVWWTQISERNFFSSKSLSFCRTIISIYFCLFFSFIYVPFISVLLLFAMGCDCFILQFDHTLSSVFIISNYIRIGSCMLDVISFAFYRLIHNLYIWAETNPLSVQNRCRKSDL